MARLSVSATFLDAPERVPYQLVSEQFSSGRETSLSGHGVRRCSPEEQRRPLKNLSDGWGSQLQSSTPSLQYQQSHSDSNPWYSPPPTQPLQSSISAASPHEQSSCSSNGKISQPKDSIDRMLDKLDHMNNELDRVLKEMVREREEREVQQYMSASISNYVGNRNPSQMNLSNVRGMSSPMQNFPSMVSCSSTDFLNLRGSSPWMYHQSSEIASHGKYVYDNTFQGVNQYVQSPMYTGSNSQEVPNHVYPTPLQNQHTSAQHVFDEMLTRGGGGEALTKDAPLPDPPPPPSVPQPPQQQCRSLQQQEETEPKVFDEVPVRKLGSMSWCRRCKIQCVTMEGLVLHSLTDEHQNKTLSLVMSLKQEVQSSTSYTSKNGNGVIADKSLSHSQLLEDDIHNFKMSDIRHSDPSLLPDKCCSDSGKLKGNIMASSMSEDSGTIWLADEKRNGKINTSFPEDLKEEDQQLTISSCRPPFNYEGLDNLDSSQDIHIMKPNFVGEATAAPLSLRSNTYEGVEGSVPTENGLTGLSINPDSALAITVSYPWATARSRDQKIIIWNPGILYQVSGLPTFSINSTSSTVADANPKCDGYISSSRFSDKALHLSRGGNVITSRPLFPYQSSSPFPPSNGVSPAHLDIRDRPAMLSEHMRREYDVAAADPHNLTPGSGYFTREKVEIQRLLDDHHKSLHSKKEEFGLELEKTKQVFGEDLKEQMEVLYEKRLMLEAEAFEVVLHKGEVGQVSNNGTNSNMDYGETDNSLVSGEAVNFLATNGKDMEHSENFILDKSAKQNVTLLVPGLCKSEQELVYPNNLTFSSPEEQEAYIESDISTAPEKTCALIDSGLVDPSGLLANMDAQIVKAKEESLIRKDIMDRISKWQAACEEEIWLEEYNQDENRSSAGRGSHLNLKRVEMGYQVRFEILDAGAYGVSQSRKKAFIWAAAPGEVLPEGPELKNVFAGPELKIHLHEDMHYAAIHSSAGGAPFRSITVRDTIGELSPVENGASKPTINESFPGRRLGQLQDKAPAVETHAGPSTKEKLVITIWDPGIKTIHSLTLGQGQN